MTNLEREMRACFDFFYNECSLSENGYGLIRDRWPGRPDMASIAGVGFGLAAYCIGAEYGYVSFSAAEERVRRTFETLEKLDRFKGFYRHFYNMNTGEPFRCEVSTIDTAILLLGVHTAGNYFGGEIRKSADKLEQSVEWSEFLRPDNIFHMAYDEKRGFFAKWDEYAEQLMMYVLAAASQSYHVGKEAYYAFTRTYGKYKDIEYIYTYNGSLFTHQYSQAFIDFKGRRDKNGTDWFINAVNATRAAKAFCIDDAVNHPTYNENCWGLTACDTPRGYVGNQGNPPCGGDGKAALSLGVVPPAGALGSLPFCPDDALKALDYYSSLQKATGKYGLCDAFSTEIDWYAENVICIDKGITLVQAANLKDGFVWKVFNDERIARALDELEIKRYND